MAKPPRIIRIKRHNPYRSDSIRLLFDLKILFLALSILCVIFYLAA